MRYVVPSSVTAIALLFVSVARSAEKFDQPPQSKPLVTLSGANSHVRKPAYERIATPEDWRRVWTSHLGTLPDSFYGSRFEVDFDHCLVVAIFRGEETNIRGIQIESLSDSADSVVIRFVELGYQTAGSDNNKPPDRPYAFLVLPKTNKSIILEERIESKDVRQPPRWIERARLEGGSVLGQQSVKP
jgi:hypothetical protein